jgi:hypothetical protein
MATVVESTDNNGNFILTVTVPAAGYAAMCTAMGVSSGQLGATLLANAQANVASYQQSVILLNVRAAAKNGALPAVVAAFAPGGALAGTQ